MSQVTKAIVDNTAILCEGCGLTANHVDDGGFQCFTQTAHTVTFRAHLYSTPTSTPQELITHITHWIKNGASVSLSGLLLTVDRGCDVVIESFSEPECYRVVQTSEPLTTTETATTLETTEADSIVSVHGKEESITSLDLVTLSATDNTNSDLSFSAEVVVVGCVVVMMIFIIAVMLTVLVAYLWAKYCR